jgi:heat shock protein HslJ
MNPQRMRAKFATGMLATAAAVALAACGTSAAETNGPGSGDDTERITGVRWIPQTVTANGEELPRPARADDAYLVINPGTTPEPGGESGGHTGCNDMGADVTLDGDTLEVTDHATTLIACPAAEFEARFEEIFLSDPRFEVSASSDTLTLTGDNGDTVTLVRDDGNGNVGR